MNNTKSTYSQSQDSGASLNGVGNVISDFLSRHPFVNRKIKNGRAYCDKCKHQFPHIHPVFIVAEDSTEEIFCYPCNYARYGTSAEEIYRNKREDAGSIQSMREQKMEKGQAYQIAQGILAQLAPFCNRIFIAGSLRRMKADPKDIEIVAEPKMIELQDGLFDTKKVRINEFVKEVEGLGKILKGKPAEGRYVNIQLGGDLKLDLFIPQESDFIRQYVIRTGSANYVKHTISSAWRRLGWCGTEDGLRLMTECEKRGEDKWVCVSDNPTHAPVWQTEEDFFRWLNIEFINPENRN